MQELQDNIMENFNALVDGAHERQRASHGRGRVACQVYKTAWPRSGGAFWRSNSQYELVTGQSFYGR